MADNSILVPVEMVSPVKVDHETHFTGLLWSETDRRPDLFLFDWDGKQYAMHASGSHAFNHFLVPVGTKFSGLLLEGGRFVVDIQTRFNPGYGVGSKGALKLSNGKVFILGVAVGEGFGDFSDFPLWGDYPPGTQDEAVAFASWRLVVNDGTRDVEVYNHSSERPDR